MPDVYDKQIKMLTEKPQFLVWAWTQTWALFQFVTPTGDRNYNGRQYGCILGVKSGRKPAYTSELTEIIRAANIPDYVENLKIGHLQEIARLQRIVDKKLGRDATKFK